MSFLSYPRWPPANTNPEPFAYAFSLTTSDAVARPRRAFVRPILAAPPVRAIHASFTSQSSDENGRIALKNEQNLVSQRSNYWPVLTRTSLAGFNAPIDNTDSI